MSLTLIPILAHALSLTAGDYSELRVRSDGGARYVDLSTTPQIGLTLTLRRTNWTLYYAPTVMEMGFGSANPTRFVIHAGGLRARLQVTPRTAVTWSELAIYGTQNFRSQALGAPGPAGLTGSNATGQPNSAGGQGNSSTVVATPGNSTISYATLTSTLGLEHSLQRNLVSLASAGYTIQGQLDSSAVVVIPRARILFGSVGLAYMLNMRNRLLASESVRYVLLEPTSRSYMLTSNVGWSHVYSAKVASNVFLSESYVNSIDRVGEHTSQVLPGAGANLTVTDTVRPMSSQLTATISTAIMPFIDPQGGGVTEMVNTNVDTIWTRRRLSLQFSGFYAHSLASYGSVTIATLYGLSEGIGYQLDRRKRWMLSAGSRQAFQKFSAGAQLPMLWAAFIGITYTSGTINL